jgi:AcrR family transcriptional regulator
MKNNSKHGDFTKKKLLDATFESIYKEGIANVSMRSIAQKAGVNQAVIHYHFKNKENLLLEFLNEIFHRINANFNRIYAEPSMEKGIAKIVGTAKNLIKTKKKVFVVFMDCWSLSMRNKEMQKKFAEHFHRDIDFFIRFLGKMKKQDSLHDIDERFFAASVVSLVCGLSLVANMIRENKEFEAHFDQWGEILARALLETE